MKRPKEFLGHIRQVAKTPNAFFDFFIFFVRLFAFGGDSLQEGRHMEPSKKADDLAHRIIGMAIDIHREVGPGLHEAIYERAMTILLAEAGIPIRVQPSFPVLFRGQTLGVYRPDLIVDELIVVEMKSTERNHPAFKAQVLAYLRVTGLDLGLLLNFNRGLMREGVERVIWHPSAP